MAELNVEKGMSGVAVVIDANFRIDTSLRIEEVVKIAENQYLLVTRESKDRWVK